MSNLDVSVDSESLEGNSLIGSANRDGAVHDFNKRTRQWSRRDGIMTAAIIAGGGIAGVGLGVAFDVVPVDEPASLGGRIGGLIATWEQRASGHTPFRATGDRGELRLAWMMPPGRIVADVLPGGRVRQVSVGRERQTSNAVDVDPDDWTIAEAGEVARAWLPRDAVFQGVEAFVVGDREAGPRERFESRSLARVLTVTDYLSSRAEGPPGACLAQYYVTNAGGVAFILVGLA